VVVADGLLAFLAQDDMIALLNRLTGHFPSGEVAFNGYSRFAIWAAKHYHGTQSVADLIRSPGFDDPREPERLDHSLRLIKEILIKEILLTREPEVSPSSRRSFASSPAWRHTARPCPEEALRSCITASRGVCQVVRLVFVQDGCVQVCDVISDEAWAVIEAPLLATIRCVAEASPERGGRFARWDPGVRGSTAPFGTQAARAVLGTEGRATFGLAPLAAEASIDAMNIREKGR
jgi:hypothetical protein